MFSPTPYAYTIRDSGHCFPSLGAAVQYLIQQKLDPYSAFCRSPVTCHYLNSASDWASLEDYLEEVPVDVAPIEAELDAAIALSRERYEREYPTPEDKAYERSRRYSGGGWLHEQDRAEMIQQQVNRLKWKWKDYTTSP